MTIEEHYQAIFNNAQRSFEKLRNDQEIWQTFAECHSNCLEYERLARAIEDRPECELFRLAIKEYQFAMVALSFCQYRHAFGGLRLTMEMMLASIYHSAHEIDFRLWRQGKKDIKWSTIIDDDNGIFSHQFCTAFNEDLKPLTRQYKTIIERLYRECSEFVHGNPETHDSLPDTIDHDKESVSSWCSKAKSVRMIVTFSFCLRYMLHLGKEKILKAEDSIRESVGHIPEIRNQLDNPRNHD
jgi:hypothetical protein